MCGIIARDKRNGQVGKKSFNHFGQAIQWMYKNVGDKKPFEIADIYPKKTNAFWRARLYWLK